MSVDLEAAQVTKYSLQSRYVIPIGDPAVENLTLAGTVIQQELADVDARTMSIGPSITRVMGNWQTVWFVNGVQSTGTVNTSWLGAVNPANKQCVAGATAGTSCYAGVTIGIPTNDMLVPGVDLASVPKGYLGEPMFEHGFFAEIRGSQGAFGSKANFLQIHIELERAFRLSRKWHLLLRDEFGATAASHFGEMPPAMRFYAGGEGSVRGFEYDGLSPTQKYCLSGSRDLRRSAGRRQGRDHRDGGVRSRPAAEFRPRVLLRLRQCVQSPRAAGAGGLQQRGADRLHQGAAAAVRRRHRVSVPPAGADARHRHRPAAVGSAGSPRLYINFSPKL